MSRIRIVGGGSLFGEVRVGGAKNAALPIIFAVLITHGVSIIENVPDISDVCDCIRIIEAFGAVVTREGDTLKIDTRKLSYKSPPADAVCRIRASTYLIGGCLSRFGIAELMPFGGCNFSKRPIDLHLQIAELFGAKRMKNTLVSFGLHPTNAVLSKLSVGATVNALLLASSTEGVSRITPYAKEPHVVSLIEYLRSAGAEIEMGENTLTVRGTRLHGGYARIVGDMVEAGSYLAAGIATGGEVAVCGLPPEQLSSFLTPLSDSGVSIECSEERIVARGIPKSRITIKAAPYPEYPTDLQPIIAPLLAVGAGGEIYDTVWCERFGYLGALEHFGLRFESVPSGAIIKKSAFAAGVADAPDLRGGWACVIAALCASGESIINNSQIIYRGYERLSEKLAALGAEIYDV